MEFNHLLNYLILYYQVTRDYNFLNGKNVKCSDKLLPEHHFFQDELDDIITRLQKYQYKIRVLNQALQFYANSLLCF